MALANGIQALPSFCVLWGGFNRKNATRDHREVAILSATVQALSGDCSLDGFISWRFQRRGRIVDGHRRLNAAGTRLVDDVQSRTTSISTIEIPITCYQIIGVSEQAEKDEVVKSVMNLKRTDIEEGYTMEAAAARQDLLMDVRDKLLFEPEFAGNVKEKIAPKSPLRIPWSWLPGALCLLQEVGEDKLVLDIGKAALQHPNSKPYVHDLLLSMALAECANAKVGFESNKVSQGFEALARAQSLLKSKVSLGEMALLTQIEESLEELAPACTLEVLGMPRIPENAERRKGAIAALRELLKQGLDVETSCQVQDWSCFLNQALSRLMASEIVDLLPWDSIAIVRKNKKSLESQNQRVVIDFNNFYMVLIAHIAIGFSSKQTDKISKADTICECLITSEGVDLKFEQAICQFLTGQGTEAEALEKLKLLESNADSAVFNSLGGKEREGMTPSLETWLKDRALGLFPDTRACSPSLSNFFAVGNKHTGIKRGGAPPMFKPRISNRPVSTSSFERLDFEDSRTLLNSSRHLDSAVKQLALMDTQNTLISADSSDADCVNSPSVQLKRNFGLQQGRVWESWFPKSNVIQRVTLVALLASTLLFFLKIPWINFGRLRCLPVHPSYRSNSSSLAWKTDSRGSKDGPTYIKGKGVTGRINSILAMVKKHIGGTSNARYLQRSCLPASLSSPMSEIHRKLMPVEEAEELVRQWQCIKAEALGYSHQVDSLSEVLDDSMLVQWQSLADAAIVRSCYWKFVLLQLTILQAHVFSDRIGGEMAEIEALLEEAAELVDDSQPKNAKYYSNYKVRYVLRKQDDGAWKFCEGDVRTPE